MVVQFSVEFFRELFLPLSDKLVAALVLILIGLIVGRIGDKVIQYLLAEFRVNKTLDEVTHVRFPVEGAIGLCVRYLTYVVFVLLALNTLGLTTLIIELGAIAGLVALLIAALLAARDIVPNLIAGIKLYRGVLIAGQEIVVGDVKGKVQKLTLTHTLLKTKGGDIMVVPNAFLLRQPLIRKKK